MSVWTDGKTHVVVGPAGLSIHRDDEVQLILAADQLGGQLPPKKGKAGFARIRPLAVNAGVELAFTVDAERKLVRAPLGEAKGDTLKFPWDISALAPADGQRVFAAYVTGTKARALTSIVLGSPPADPKGKWEHEYENDKPKKVDWPENLLWEKAPWSRKTRWATDPDLIQVNANPHAYTVYDTASAVVGVLRRPGPKQPPEGFACVLRTPQEKGTTVAATATSRGVLVATCKPDGQAVICEFADDGKLLAHRLFTAKKIGPLALAGSRVFALVEDRKLLILDSELAPEAELELGDAFAAGPSQVQLRPNPEGTGFLLAVADKVLRGVASDAGAWSLTELDLTSVPPPGEAHAAEIAEAEIEQPNEPTGANGQPLDSRTRIITQAPRLSLNPQQPNDAWSFPAGGHFEIALNAVSVGGPAETGLQIEVHGDALDKGLIELESVAIEGTNQGQASFEIRGKKRVALLPEFRLPAGVDPVKDRKIKPKDRFLENPEDTFVTVRLSGKTLAPGSELIYVRVGFDGTDEGSLMRGRPLTVS
ncbi:hypothetical protein ENSA5_17910 [Enhygromyxa salina]|uniref:Uncharacterized protein n=1 Tax=Enhygromyxa salina TaxID=215803 RepID=A0A2S9YDH8_9BACT|nr:hypothetical protein [Enhygromyxa salina]PRQ03170.1 hypothetical protein ENSA5_17910 [Enhygromyxa salina]